MKGLWVIVTFKRLSQFQTRVWDRVWAEIIKNW